MCIRDRGWSDQPFMLNGSEDHAAIIVERMFVHAESEMRILTQRLDPAIYEADGVIQQLNSFASNPETQTKIIVENISDEALSAHKIFRISKRLPNVEVRRLPNDISSELKFNFSVMDRRGYRFESDKNKVNAIVRFDDAAFTSDVLDYFDGLYGASASTDQIAA